jgi:hypothetical protein
MRYPLRAVYQSLNPDPIRVDELIISLDNQGRATQAKIEFRELQ